MTKRQGRPHRHTRAEGCYNKVLTCAIEENHRHSPQKPCRQYEQVRKGVMQWVLCCYRPENHRHSKEEPCHTFNLNCNRTIE